MNFKPILAILFLTFFVSSLPAQGFLMSDYSSESGEEFRFPSSTKISFHVPNKVTTTLSIPFFEDFSDGMDGPNSGRWEITDNRPNVGINKGLRNPSKGVATFNGIDFSGQKYAQSFSKGISDELHSHNIDISEYSPTNKVALSFFVQAAGQCEPPEATDSFFVYFGLQDSTFSTDSIVTIEVDSLTGDTNIVVTYSFDTLVIRNYEQIYSIGGKEIDTSSFHYVYINIDSAKWYQPSFNLMFASYGNQNGENDNWHLDYIRLENFLPNETVTTDASPLYFIGSPLGKYTALPSVHYQDTLLTTQVRVPVYNLGNGSAEHQVFSRFESPDPVSGMTLSGNYLSLDTFQLLPDSLSEITLDSLEDQYFGGQNGLLKYKVTIIPDSPDYHPENDEIEMDIRVDSIMAYDDGVADRAFGMNYDGAVVQRFELPNPEEDSLTAVWINFIPGIYYNSGLSETTEGNSFTFVIYEELDSTPRADTVLFQKLSGMFIDNGVRINKFKRYPLSKKIAVPDVFYAGVRQNDHKPFWVGIDKDFDHTEDLFYTSELGEWLAWPYGGTLMIRPEFGSTPFAVGAAPEKPEENNISLFPNPFDEKGFNIRFDKLTPLKSMEIKVFSITGVLIHSQKVNDPQGIIQITPKGTASGIYQVQILSTLTNGEVQITHKKLLKSSK